MDSPRYLFLDIDGVLHPTRPSSEVEVIISPSKKIPFAVEALQCLSDVLAACSPRIVLSSTWRKTEEEREDLAAVFKEFGATHGGPLASFEGFYDFTEETPNLIPRKWEIAKWILKQRESGGDSAVKFFVILDDDKSLVQGKKYADVIDGHVILTDKFKGFTKQQANESLKILGYDHDI